MTTKTPCSCDCAWPCRQGSFWYRAIPAMHEDRLRTLMAAFVDVLSQHNVFNQLFGVI
jgi:hypothetical protein